MTPRTVPRCEALALECPLCGVPPGWPCVRVSLYVPRRRQGESIPTFHHPRLRLARQTRTQRAQWARRRYLAQWLHLFGDMFRSEENNNAPTPRP